VFSRCHESKKQCTSGTLLLGLSPLGNTFSVLSTFYYIVHQLLAIQAISYYIVNGGQLTGQEARDLLIIKICVDQVPFKTFPEILSSEIGAMHLCDRMIYPVTKIQEDKCLNILI